MSAKLNVGLTIGVLAVMLIMSTATIYFTQQGRIQSEHNNVDIDRVEKKVDEFIEKWENRIKISNQINNSTQAKIERAVTDILGNLTSHRIVTNISNERIEHLVNKTDILTGPEYERLADQRVKDIVGNITAYIESVIAKDIGRPTF